MGVPDLGLLVLVGYTLLQVPLAVYVARAVARDDEASAGRVDPPRPPPGYEARRGRVPTRPPTRADGRGVEHPETDDAAAVGDGVVCPRCGVANGPEYDYCERCVAPLGR